MAYLETSPDGWVENLGDHWHREVLERRFTLAIAPVEAGGYAWEVHDRECAAGACEKCGSTSAFQKLVAFDPDGNLTDALWCIDCEAEQGRNPVASGTSQSLAEAKTAAARGLVHFQAVLLRRPKPKPPSRPLTPAEQEPT